jgi:hypothetical protein
MVIHQGKLEGGFALFKTYTFPLSFEGENAKGESKRGEASLT